MSISKRSRAARRGWAQRETKHVKLIDHIFTIKVQSPGRRGKPGRTTIRDIIVPARPGTRKAELLWLANKRLTDLPKKEQYVGYILASAVAGVSKKHASIYSDSKITIAEGPRTRSRKVKLR